MKSDEKILCIPRSALPCEWLKGNGATLLDESVFRAGLGYGDTSFQKRGEAETDSAWKQLIPYVVVERFDGQVMTYPRHGSETRLHGLYSIGAGGHVNDGDKIAGDLFATLVSGARREIKEELGFDPENRLVLRGIINEEITEAGKVHLGVVFSLRVHDSFVPGLLPELAGAQFFPVSDIRKLNLEYWSRLALLLLAYLQHDFGIKPKSS